LLRTLLRHLNEEKLFAFFWFCNVCWNERILCSRKSVIKDYNLYKWHIKTVPWMSRSRPPLLCETISNLPFIVNAMGDLVELRTRRRGKVVIQTPFEPFYFVFAWFDRLVWSPGLFWKIKWEVWFGTEEGEERAFFKTKIRGDWLIVPILTRSLSSQDTKSSVRFFLAQIPRFVLGKSVPLRSLTQRQMNVVSMERKGVGNWGEAIRLVG